MLIAVAYCWASGEIGDAFEDEGFELPEGTILFARGEADALMERLDARARHGYEEGVLLVPGLSELEDDGDDALDVLVAWRDWAFADWPLIDGVRTQHAGGEV